MELKINDFGNLEKITEVFRSLNGLGNSNCIIVATDREYNPSSPNLLKNNSTIAGARLGGIGGAIAGNLVAGAIQESVYKQLEEAADSLKNQELRVFFDKSVICGWILNITENGIGFIPLTNNKKLIVKLEEMVAETDAYIFVENKDIKSIELNNAPLNFKKDKKILKITYNDGTINPISVLTISKRTNAINYQEASFEEIAKKY